MSLETKKNGKSNYFTDTIKTNFVRTIKQHYALLLVEVFSPLTWGTSPFFLSKISLRILFPILKSNWVETLYRKRFHKYIRVTYKLIAKTQGNDTHTLYTQGEREKIIQTTIYIELVWARRKGNFDRDKQIISSLTSKLFDFNTSLSLASEKSASNPCFNWNSSLDFIPIWSMEVISSG